MTVSTKKVTSTRISTAARVKEMLASSFSTFSFLKAMSSLASLTKALMTAMPEKLSWAKSDSLENASCRRSHFLVRCLPSMVEAAMRAPMGIRARTVSRWSIRHML